MDVIIFDNTEKTPLLIKTLQQLDYPNPEVIDDWDTNHISRCPRCQRIFFSRTNKKYCSKECQYNQGKKNE